MTAQIEINITPIRKDTRVGKYCQNCGKRFNVRREIAAETTLCPTCRRGEKTRTEGQRGRALEAERVTKSCAKCLQEFTLRNYEARYVTTCPTCRTLARDGEAAGLKRLVSDPAICGVPGCGRASLEGGKRLCLVHSRPAAKAVVVSTPYGSTQSECDRCANKALCQRMVQSGAPVACEQIDFSDVIRTAGRVKLAGIPKEVVKEAREVCGKSWMGGEK